MPRRPNTELRPREHLTEDEVTQLMEAARARGRHGHRDATMILIAFRHGLRATELVRLRWTQVDFTARTLHVNRLKRGKSCTHQLTQNEITALEKLPQRGREIFIGERGPLSSAGFAKIVKQAAVSIDFPLAAHPHMLRHACGYKLANDGCDTRIIQDYLGHRNIQHTVRYTELAPGRFHGLFQD